MLQLSKSFNIKLTKCVRSPCFQITVEHLSQFFQTPPLPVFCIMNLMAALPPNGPVWQRHLVEVKGRWAVFFFFFPELLFHPLLLYMTPKQGNTCTFVNDKHRLMCKTECHDAWLRCHITANSIREYAWRFQPNGRSRICSASVLNSVQWIK